MSVSSAPPDDLLDNLLDDLPSAFAAEPASNAIPNGSPTALLPTDQPASDQTPQQKRFARLMHQISLARGSLELWRQSVDAFRLAYVKQVHPLETALVAARLARVHALDALHGQAQWTEAEMAALSGLVCLALRELLERDAEDAALQALYARHAHAAFDEEKLREMKELNEMIRLATGLEIDDAGDIESDEEFLERLQRKTREEARTEQAEREARRAQGRERDEGEDEKIAQSLRELFRKLASLLHPDREPDEARRATKTELMQQANQAYAAGDLLTLLQLQLQLEEMNFGHFAQAGEETLAHYIEALSGQLAEVKREMRRVEGGFRFEFGLPPDARISAARLEALIREDGEALRERLARLQEERELLADHEAARRWLKRRRRMLGQFDQAAVF